MDAPDTLHGTLFAGEEFFGDQFQGSVGHYSDGNYDQVAPLLRYPTDTGYFIDSEQPLLQSGGQERSEKLSVGQEFPTAFYTAGMALSGSEDMTDLNGKEIGSLSEGNFDQTIQLTLISAEYTNQ